MPDLDADLLKDLKLMRDVALEAGALAMEYQAKGEARHWSKVGGSPVTEADMAVNALCSDRLRSSRPDYGWLSEETADDPSMRQRECCWVVDPIDGTRAYMRDDPYWCIALAVVEGGNPIAGVIFASELDHLYEASKGGGAFLNGDRISATDPKSEQNCRLITSLDPRSTKYWSKEIEGVTFADPKPNATLLRLAFVASGAWDATLVLGHKADWDLAAGAILISEAGGLATTHLSESFNFNQHVPVQRSIVAAGKTLHPLLVRRSNIVSIPDPQISTKLVTPAPRTEPKKMAELEPKQLLHIVFGGELSDLQEVEFEDLSKVEFIGAFGSYAEAYDAWKGAAQRTVDNAEMRFFILHAHKLLDPETGDHHHV